MKARLHLSAEQIADLSPLIESVALLPRGARLLGEIRREEFSGSNVASFHLLCHL